MKNKLPNVNVFSAMESIYRFEESGRSHVEYNVSIPGKYGSVLRYITALPLIIFFKILSFCLKIKRIYFPSKTGNLNPG